MAGVWPNLDAADLELKVRTYLNEASADFYTQAEIWRWLSLAARNISQTALCVRRVLDAQTNGNVRTVNHNAHQVLAVEYIPSTGRRIFLQKITPLQLGHFPLDGVTPQYWYDFGGSIGIDPLPPSVYELRLFVADLAKMNVSVITDFTTGWTAGTGWTGGANAYHVNAASGDLTYNTTLSASTNYTFTVYVASIGTGGSLTPYVGTTTGTPITTVGYHTQNLVSSAGAPALKFTAVNSVEFDNLTILKEADYAAVGDQTELQPEWQHLMALYATYNGLLKDGKLGPARMLESIYYGELTYMKNQFVDIVPNGLDEQRQQ